MRVLEETHFHCLKIGEEVATGGSLLSALLASRI